MGATPVVEDVRSLAAQPWNLSDESNNGSLVPSNDVVEQPLDKIQACYFGRLPLEIILAIEDRLSRADLLCFRLSCKDLWTHEPVLDTETTRLLTTEPQEKYLFLRRIERDKSSLFACGSCQKLHSVNKLTTNDLYWNPPRHHKSGRRRPALCECPLVDLVVNMSRLPSHLVTNDTEI